MFCMYNYFVTFVNTISIAQMHWNDYTLCINYHLCKDFSHAKHYSIRVKVIMSKLHAHCFLVYSQRRNKRGLVTTKLAILILPKVLHMEVSERTSILLQYSCMILKLKYWIEWETTHTTLVPPTAYLLAESFSLSEPSSIGLFNLSLVSPWHKQFSCALSVVESANCSWSLVLSLWTGYKYHLSVSYIQQNRRSHSWEYDNIVAEHNVESHHIPCLHFTFTPVSISHMSFALWLVNPINSTTCTKRLLP